MIELPFPQKFLKFDARSFLKKGKNSEVSVECFNLYHSLVFHTFCAFIIFVQEPFSSEKFFYRSSELLLSLELPLLGSHSIALLECLTLSVCW